MNIQHLKTYFELHFLLMAYSLSSVCSKLAGNQEFLSLPFCLSYGCVLTLLLFYAIGWQQIIKRLPLTTAFSNKAVTVVWGIIWGAVFFQEPITIKKIIGAILIIAGVVLYARADATSGEEGSNHE